MKSDDHKIHSPEKTAKANHVLGLFTDDSDLIDEIVESAMIARENDPLRNNCDNGNNLSNHSKRS